MTADGNTSLVHGIGGLDLGVGRFVSHNVALSLRIAGVTGLDNGLSYLGVLGPHAQLWLEPQGWIGAGIGVGFAIGCGGGVGCNAATTSTSFDVRAGYAFSSTPGGGGNVSIRRRGVSAGSVSITAISFLLGCQAF